MISNQCIKMVFLNIVSKSLRHLKSAQFRLASVYNEVQKKGAK